MQSGRFDRIERLNLRNLAQRVIHVRTERLASPDNYLAVRSRNNFSGKLMNFTRLSQCDFLNKYYNFKIDGKNKHIMSDSDGITDAQALAYTQNVELRQFFFSVILSTINKEQRLEEAIEDIFSQDIDFRNNIELILVADGTSSSNLEFCEQFIERYPENVIVIDSREDNLSSGRNAGLSEARGRYIHFLDPSVSYSKNTLTEVQRFAEQSTEEQLAFITIPIAFNGTRRGLDPNYHPFPKTNCIIDLSEKPGNLIFSSAATFYPSNIIKQHHFDTSKIHNEGALLNLSIHANSSLRFGYLGKRRVYYSDPQHGVSPKQIHSDSSTIQGFESGLTLLEKTIPAFPHEVPDYLIELIVHTVSAHFQEVQPELFSSPEDYAHMLARFTHYIDRFDAKRLQASPWIQTRQRQYALASGGLSREPWSLGSHRSVVDRGTPTFALRNLLVRIKSVQANTHSMFVDAIFHDYQIPDLDLVLTDNFGTDAPLVSEFRGNTAHDARYGHLVVSPTCQRRFQVPFTDKETVWNFYFLNRATGERTKAERFIRDYLTPFSTKEKALAIVRPRHSIQWIQSALVVSPKKTHFHLHQALMAWRLYRKYNIPPLARLLSRRRKSVILLSDRPAFGDDNAESLFRYIQNSRPELKSDTWLVLNSTAPSYSELKRTNRTVTAGSLKHRILQLNSRIVAASHLATVFTYAFDGKETRHHRDLFDFSYFWLQHGVTINSVSRVANRLYQNIEGIVVATDHEKRFLTDSQHFFQPEQVLATGFPRFDNLKSVPERKILIMPTWRSWLTGSILPNGTHMPLEGFEESDYFRRFKSLLTNSTLLSALKNNEFVIEFAMHPGMSAYTDRFQSLSSEFVKIMKPGSATYQDMFARGDIIVTDYSSVLFDFAYLEKPIVMYQFDAEEYSGLHYKRGIFDYETMAPGPVIKEESELVTHLIQSIESGCRMSDSDLDRLQSVFLHKDQNNSERVINAMLALDATRRKL